MGVTPYVISKNQQVKLISLNRFGFRFIARTEYLVGNFPDLIKQLNLKAEKYYFPQQLNTRDNYGFTGKLKIEDFSDEWDNEGVKQEKLNYLNLTGAGNWDFQEEIRIFAINELILLTYSCLVFYENCLNLQVKCIKLFGNWRNDSLTFLSPFSNSISVPGFVYSVFRYFALDERSMKVVKHEWGIFPQTSLPEIQFTEWHRSEYPKKYITAYSHPGNELHQYKCCKPDMMQKDPKIAYFFNGCEVHGHMDSRCTLAKQGDLYGQSFKARYNDFQKKLAGFRRTYPGIPAIVSWHCHWEDKKAKNEKIQNFLKHHLQRPKERINVRQSCKGGINEVYCHYEKSDVTSVIQGFDTVSLYPHVAMISDFPVDDYQVLLGDSLDNALDISFVNEEFYYRNEKINGVAHCTVLPPQNLKFPFLLCTIKGHSLAPLCFACAKRQTGVKCKHGIKKRRWTENYTLPEINYARTLGYNIYFHEIYHYPKTSKIFSKFIKLLSLEKISSSGLPEGVDAELFCQDINTKMGFDEINEQIVPADIKFEPGRRLAAKTYLNSFLGKFMLNETKYSATCYVNSKEELHDLFQTGDVLSVKAVTETICQVTLAKKTPQAPNRTINATVGSYVTALARVFISEKVIALDKAKAKILYCDCDSVYFKAKRNAPFPLTIGHSFGEFQKIHDGEIKSLAVLGPKSYSVLWEKNNQLYSNLKVSGFCFTYDCSRDILTHDTLSHYANKLISNELCSIQIPQLMRMHDKLTKNCYTVRKKKLLKNMYFKKRVLVSCEGSTLPFGFIEN
jgi:hypothetical protein